MNQRVIISTHLEGELVSALAECEHDKLFVLTDTTTQKECLPLLKKFYCMKEAQVITIPATDSHKDIESLMMVWKGLQEGGASRHSCMINLGGGMVTDLGGFAASTFKRGINFVNIPTTLLAMVDASVGGKTGINFGGLKNEVGVFNDSKFVILDTEFLKTLDAENICSGYAEMLKHGLISTEAMWEELVSFDLANPDLKQLQRMVGDSVKVKERIVEQDPHEKGIRKALNLGHTFGHAFESWALKRKPILHGYAADSVSHCLEIRILISETDFIIEEIGYNGVLAVWHDQSHLAILLGYYWHDAQVIIVDVARAEKIIHGLKHHVALMVFHAKLAVLLEHLVITDVLLLQAMIVEYHLALIVHEIQHILERIAIVSHRTNQNHLQVQTVQCLSVQIDILGNRLLLLWNREACQSFLKLEHSLFSSRHSFNVSVNLSAHFRTDKLVYLLLLYRVSIVLNQ